MAKRQRTHREQPPETMPDRRALWVLPLLVATLVGVYAPRLGAPFIYDDLATIEQNPHIRSLWPPGQVLSAPPQTPLAGRPVVCLSLAVSYALGGLAVHGYHLFSLTVHVFSMLLLYSLVARTLRNPVFGDRYHRSASWLALAVSALWALHPLQTEAVIYVIQRTELLMAFFYLLTVYCFLRGAEARHPLAWYAAAVTACAVGMGCKEVMVSAPVVVLLYDRAFLARSFGSALRRRSAFYAALALTWLVLAALVVGGPRSQSTGFGHDISALDYLRTQAGVMVHYLRLCFWPAGLVISYDDWPIARAFSDTMVQGFFVLGLLGASVWAVVRYPVFGFLGAWFFCILAPTSSFVPIITEVAAERRMYLPLLVPVILVVLGTWQLLQWADRRCILAPSSTVAVGGVAVVALAMVLAGASFLRGRDYENAVAIWQDTVDKRPHNAAAHINLGNALLHEAHLDQALSHYEIAVRLKPEDFRAHYNLANALVEQNRAEEALPFYTAAQRLSPGNPDVCYNLGIALSKLGRVDEEIEQYDQVLRLDPQHIGACNNLGMAHLAQGALELAVPCFQRALGIDPQAATVRLNLGDAFLDAGRFEEAAAQYRQVLSADAGNLKARFHLAITLATQGRRPEAMTELREVLRRDPGHDSARRMLEDMGQ